MASQFYWNGQLYTSPAAVSAVNDSGFGPSSLGSGNTVAFIGESAGGQPNVPLYFTSPEQAAATLISGDLLTAVAKAFDPSPVTGTPGTVIAMVVGQASQSTASVMDNSGGSVLTLTSTQYGLPAGETQFEIQHGSAYTSSIPTWQVSVALGNTTLTQDNIGRIAFTTTYSGSQSTATIQVTDTTITLCAPAATVVATINLSLYTTVDQAVAQINGVPGFNAAIGMNAIGTPALNGLDFLPGAQSCLTGFVTLANTQAILEWFNNSSGLITAARTIGHSTGFQVAVTPWTFLTGTNLAPVPVVQDFTNALTAMQAVPCNWMAVLTPYAPPTTGAATMNEAIWAALAGHVQMMSTVARQERRGFVGTFAGDTLSAVEAYPIALNSDRIAFCYPGYQDFDVNGNLVTYGSYMTAALVAACFAGLPVGTAMTNKPVTVQGLEVKLANPLQTDPLIEAGVLCIQATKKGCYVVRSISTWLVNDNYDRVEVSTGAAVDFVAQTLRAAVRPFLGQGLGPKLLGLAFSAIQSALIDMAVPAPNGPGVIVGDGNSPAWQNITVSITGDQLVCACEVSPVIPANFVGINISLNAYSGTASS